MASLRLHIYSQTLMVVAALNCASAQEFAGFKSCEDPKERTAMRWCPSKLRADGWSLKYQSDRSRQMYDVEVAAEVWVRGEQAFSCIYLGGRGGTRINHCEPLLEVKH